MALLCWAVVLLAGFACSSAELGRPTSVEENPSIVQVEILVDNLWLPHCAASVLTNYHVLSTAQCFSGTNYSDRTRRIRAGTSYSGTGGIVREVDRVNIHPSFGLLGNDGDIAVVRIQYALTLGATISQALILGQGISLPTGSQVTLVSWGTTSEGGNIGSNNLYELDLYTVDEEVCLETYFFINTITENMFCAGLRGTQGRDLDSKDVGAPLFYHGTTVGVVSFGVSDGEDKIPVVSTAIGSYTEWIVEAARN